LLHSTATCSRRTNTTTTSYFGVHVLPHSVFWDMMLCSLIGIDIWSVHTDCTALPVDELIHTLIPVDQTARRRSPEDGSYMNPKLKHGLFLRANFPCVFHFSPSRSNKDLNSVSVTQTVLSRITVLRELGRVFTFLESSNSGLFKIRR